MRIQRVLANNPGPYTGPGTNTWLLEDDGEVAVIDPGPVDPAHRDRILERVGGRIPIGVLVTHTHPDHAPMANPLAAELGVPAFGYAPGPEFDPDLVLAERSGLTVGGSRIDVVHTPGHAEDHLCFRIADVLFTGDHIMGGSSVVVEDMGSYMASLEKLRGTGLTMLHPGHGEDIEDPDRVIDWYLAHRRQRHEEILEAIRSGAASTDDIVEVVYRDVDRALHPLAARSVRAHLRLLSEEGRIASAGPDLFALPTESI
ncbi:MAG TPA: MBL fold metallo-hydrolase [Acidimicrobiia bacterium]|nr:MBL fold metallo-hydrolase [Acidimicrobiia bacterium]